MATLGNDYVRFALGGFNKLHMHGAHSCEVLFDHRLHRASALRDVSPQPPNETNVVGSIDKDFNIHLFQQPCVGKDQNSFDDHDWLWRSEEHTSELQSPCNLV